MESTIKPTKTLAELVQENPARARLFEAHSLDFCCGGAQPLEEACDEQNLDLDEIRHEIADLDARHDPEQEADVDSISEYVDYIVDHHHAFLRDELGPLSRLVAKVEGVHGENHPELHKVAEVYEALARELPVHLSEEEQILFPIVRQLDGQEASSVEAETAEQLLEGLENDHDETAKHLETIREVTDDFAFPDDACPSYKNMLARLEELERDVHMHVHRENNVLFEKVRKLVEN